MSPVAVRKTVAQAVEEVGFDLFSTSSYAGGKTIPEGDYALAFTAMTHQATKQDGSPAGRPRVGTMLTAYPLAGGDPLEQFLALGGKADQSWAPRSDGKHFTKVAGGPGIPPTNKSNWFLFMDSLLQCLSQEEVNNIKGMDFSYLDGIHVHITPVPEPEERKSFKKAAATGEGGEDEDGGQRGSGLVPNVTAVLGKPWVEGEGGFDGLVAEAPAKAVAPKVAPKAAVPARAAAPKAAPKAAAPIEVAEEGDDADLETIAVSALGDVLSTEEFANGETKMKVRIALNKAITKSHDAATATAVLNAFFANDEALATLIGTVGYTLTGTGPAARIVPA